MSVPIPHKPVLRDFPGSRGNASHSEPALGDLVSTMLLCAVTLHGGVQALCRSSAKHSHAPPARASMPGDRAGSALFQGRAGIPAQQWPWEPPPTSLI